MIMKYPGSKKNKASDLIRMFPSHEIYCEAFCGSAAVLLSKNLSKKEIINDIDNELMNFYRVVLTDYDKFKQKVKYLPSHKELFDWLKTLETDDNIIRAVKTYYRYTFGFSGMNYYSLRLQQNSFSSFMEERYEIFRKRMAKVQLLSMDAVRFIEKMDKKQTFFYLDPPYFEANKRLYDHMFEKKDHIRLAACLKNIKGKFLLSYNDVPEIRELYSWANIETLKFNYTMGNKINESGPIVNELLIDNYRLSQLKIDEFAKFGAANKFEHNLTYVQKQEEK